MRFLGHVVSENGIAVDPAKVATGLVYAQKCNGRKKFLGVS